MSKRIALISEHASPLAILGGCDCGGQNVYVGQVALGLSRLGYRVDVFTRRDDMGLPEIVDWTPGVRIIHVPAGPARPVRKEDLLPYMRDFGRYMESWLKQGRGRYDLIHANFFMSGMVARALCERWGIPFVMTFHALGAVRRLHQGVHDQFPRERNLIESEIAADADAILAECPQDAKDLGVFYGVALDKLRLVPCGFDPAQFWAMDKGAARREIGMAPDEPLFVHVGRMVPRKGIDTIIEAMARLRDQHRLEASLIIVGGETDRPDGRVTPEIGRLKALAARLHVSDEVIFAGRRRPDQLRPYYSAADLFVTTPWYEPFGITPLEAMACGTPVLGSAVGGIKYTVRHKETGYLVPPHNPAAVALYMAHALRAPEERQRLGRQALARATSLCTWQKVAELVDRAYGEVLKARAHANLGRMPAFCGDSLAPPRSFLN
ncbi:MAG: glycosyltransferase [Acidiferrobacter thiooxydans]